MFQIVIYVSHVCSPYAAAKLFLVLFQVVRNGLINACVLAVHTAVQAAYSYVGRLQSTVPINGVIDVSPRQLTVLTLYCSAK